MTTTTTANRIAANVRAEMGRRQITQTGLADVLNLSQTAVSRRLSGQVPFNVEELARIAAALNVDLSVLVDAA